MIIIECTTKEINEGFQLIVDNSFTIKVKSSVNNEQKKSKKLMSDIERLKIYFSSKKTGDIISRLELRSLKLVKPAKFAKWIEEAMTEVMQEFSNVEVYKAKGNFNGWIIK